MKNPITDPLNPRFASQLNEEETTGIQNPQQPFYAEYAQADLYVKMAHKTTGRSFWAYSAMIVMTVITLLALFNQYMTYDEAFIKEMKTALADPTQPHGIMQASDMHPISAELRSNKMRHFVDSQYINLPIFGIHICNDDILILAALSMFLISLWKFICDRSENLTIGKILRMTQKKDINIKQYIFYGICFNNMFYPTTNRFVPYKELPKIRRTFKDEASRIKEKRGKFYVLSRLGNYLIYLSVFLPTICILICFISNFSDYSSFNNQVDDTMKIFRWDFASKLNENTNSHIIWRITLSGILCALIVVWNCKSFDYLKGTSYILRQYKKRFKHNEECKNKIREYAKSRKPEKVVVAAINQATFAGSSVLDQFSEYYKEENGYFLLTHTTDPDELKRIVDMLADNEDNIWPEGIKLSTTIEEPEIFPFKRPGWRTMCKEKFEHFIFLYNAPSLN